jgi:aldehyde dehydrogenase (NAD+)
MLPYGGYKLSGIGRENGMEAIHHYTEVKTVVVDFDPAPPADPFAD